RLAGQLGLAGAGGALDEDQRPIARARPGESFTQRSDLALALEQEIADHHADDITPAAPESRGETLGDPPLFASRAAAILTLPMTVSEINKMKVRLFIEAVLNDGRLELI